MSDNASQQILANSSLGRALAERYTVLRELGAGGMATVYLAEDLRHRRKVAIKVLHPELSAVIGSDRFLKEIELTANLQHPHILPLFDSGDVNGQLYYVMPFVEGETLRGRLDREQQLPVGDAIRIAREVADALAYAHKRGIVHRDVKPENVLLQDGHALVADFGIALAVQQAGAGRLTQTGLSLGTPQYMSPEQAMGERVIDQRADIYALGAVTYEMLAGEAPFTGPTSQAIIARAMTEKPRSLMSMRETLPPAVDNAVMTALAKLPADRFATASEFAEALTREGTSTGARTVATSTPRRKNWLPWATLAAGLVVGALVMAKMRTAPAETDASAPQFWSIALPDSAPFDAGHDPYAEYVRSLDISSDGRTVVWSTQRDSNTSIWQFRTDLGAPSLIAGTSGGFSPTLSPDGQSLAFAVGREVKRVELAGGIPTSVGSAAVIEAMTWPTAERIITNDYNGCLVVSPPGGGAFTAFPVQGCLRAIGGVAPRSLKGELIASVNGAMVLLNERTGTTRTLRRAGTTDTTQASSLVAGDTPLMIGDRILLFMRDSTLYAAPVDMAAARLLAEPRQILSGVRHERNLAGGQLALSATGTLVWISGSDGAVTRFVLVGANGVVRDTVPVAPDKVNSYALSRDGKRLAYSVTLPGGKSVIRIFDLTRSVMDSVRLPVEVRVANWVDADTGISVFVPQMKPQPGMARMAIVRGIPGAMYVDSSGVPYYGTTTDGRMRCSSVGTFWPAASPADSVRFDRQGNWCRFSPDGRFISWDDMRGGLFVAPTDRSAAGARRVIAPAGANEARWTRDGRELVYRTGSLWWAVPADGGKAPRVVLRGVYNQAYASWDMTPEGNFLLLQSTPAAHATHMNVITNFPHFVDQKLSAASK